MAVSQLSQNRLHNIRNTMFCTMNVLLTSFTHSLAVISRCLAIVIILIKIFPIWHWPCVSLAWCLRLRSWRCLDWARSWGDCSVHYLMQPQWPLAPALPALSTCAWLRGPAAAQTRPKRQSSESLKINIYHGGYLSFYKRLGGGCCHAIHCCNYYWSVTAPKI